MVRCNFLYGWCWFVILQVSSELSILDLDVGFGFGFSIAASINALSSIAVTASVTWQILIVIIPFIYLTRWLQVFLSRISINEIIFLVIPFFFS